MVEATCHCGAVRIALARAPERVTACNCSICRRLGWHLAYYVPADVTVHGVTDTYSWGDRMLAFHRCRACGVPTHWTALEADLNRMGVNANLLSPELHARLPVRHFDGADTWKYLDE